MMLPKLLSGSYERYKQDTTFFTSWLAKAAIACGFDTTQLNKAKIAPPKSVVTTPRLKGRARKLAKEAAASANTDAKTPSQDQPSTQPTVTYSVTTETLLAQIETIVSSKKPKVEVPSAVCHAIQRAINARKRCAEWSATSGMKNGSSNEGHIHFIGILERALERLSPLNKEQDSKKVTDAHSQITAQSAHASADHLTSFTNRFEALNIEEDEELDDIPLPKPAKKGVSANELKSQKFELDRAEGPDYIFQRYCFFDDLHLIQEFLQETWRSYKAGKVDLVTATLTTTVGMHLVKEEEERIRALEPDLKTFGDPYFEFAASSFISEAKKQGSFIPQADYLTSDDLLTDITPFEEFIYLPIARILYSFADVYEQISPEKIFVYNLHSSQSKYAKRPEMLELPAMKKFLQDETTLCQMLLSIAVYHVWIPKLHQNLGFEVPHSLPIEDPISHGLRLIKAPNGVSLCFVFACRVFFDIQDILGDEVTDSYEKMVATAKFALSEVDYVVLNGVLGPRERQERWSEEDTRTVFRLWHTADLHVVHNPMMRFKEELRKFDARRVDPQDMTADNYEVAEKIMQSTHSKSFKFTDKEPEHWEAMKKLDVQPINLAEDSFYLFQKNPLYCGTMCFQMVMDLEASGIGLANWQESIFPAAHLYNAGKQPGLLKGIWKELDTAIELYKQNLFADQLPTTPREIYSRMLLRSGLKGSSILRSRRAGSRANLGEVKYSNNFLLTFNPLMDCFRKHYRGNDTMNQCLCKVESYMQGARRQQDKNRRTDKKWTHLQLLAAMQEQMTEEMQRFGAIKHISLTRKCIALLKRIQDKFNRELDNICPNTPRGPNQGSNEPMRLAMILWTLEDLSEWEELKDSVRRSRRHLTPKGAPMMNIAMEVMDEFIRTET